jgi:hypothetical protein
MIIGDRQTGKTAATLDTFINQKHVNSGKDESGSMHLRRHQPSIDKSLDRARARRKWRDGIFDCSRHDRVGAGAAAISRPMPA